MKKILMISSLLLINNASAQTCIPKPDCADMGYTDTSCEGTSIKCPFDTSKMICLSKLIKKVSQNCTVGMVYYSDGSCLSYVDTTKTAIGVVVKNNELVLSQRSSSTMKWSSAYVDTSLTNYTGSIDEKTDFNGKSNTATIMTDDTSNVAAKYCNDYTTAGTNAGDWYLPAFGELYSYVYGNYSAINTAMTSIGWTFGSAFWSSSEYGSSQAFYLYCNNGGYGSGSKDYNYGVSCFLEIR